MDKYVSLIIIFVFLEFNKLNSVSSMRFLYFQVYEKCINFINTLFLILYKYFMPSYKIMMYYYLVKIHNIFKTNIFFNDRSHKGSIITSKIIQVLVNQYLLVPKTHKFILLICRRFQRSNYLMQQPMKELMKIHQNWCTALRLNKKIHLCSVTVPVVVSHLFDLI